MNKACIFDFDGVIVNSERLWDIYVPILAKELYGENIANILVDLTGVSMDGLHAIAVANGSQVPIQALYDICDTYAREVYKNAEVTDGIEKLLETLVNLQYKLAIVSASPKAWLDIALKRISNGNNFSHIISLHDRKDLPHKPDPAGYREAMKLLEVSPNESIIIEDSNVGMQAAKASGAYCVGLSQHHVEGYRIANADIIVKTAGDIIPIVEKFIHPNKFLENLNG